MPSWAGRIPVVELRLRPEVVKNVDSRGHRGTLLGHLVQVVDVCGGPLGGWVLYTFSSRYVSKSEAGSAHFKMPPIRPWSM
eukprot:SAG11_NODE_1154_length_5662_cov_3.473665_6_plen_81_part_00